MRLIKKLLLSLLVCVVTISSVCILDKQEAVVQTIDADNYYNINLTPEQINNIFKKLGEDASMSAFDVVGGVFQVAGITIKVLTALGVFDDPEVLKYQNLLNKLDGIYNAVQDVNENINNLTSNINKQLAIVIGNTEQVSTQIYVNGISNFERDYAIPLESSINTVKTEVMNRVHNWYDNNDYTYNQYLYNGKFRIKTSYIDYANGAPGVRKEVEFETNGDTLNTYRIQQERINHWRDASRAEEYIKPIFRNLFDNYIRSTRNNDDFYAWLKVVDVGESNPFVGLDPITQRRDMIAKYNGLSDQQKAELREKFAAAGYESLRVEALNKYSRAEGHMSTLLSIFKAYCDRLSESSSVSGEFKNSPLRDHYNIYKTIYGFQGDLNFTRKAKVYDENGKETGETKDVTSNLAEAARVKYITNLIKFGTFVTVMAKESGDVSNDDLNRLVYVPWAAAENKINQIYNGFFKIHNGGPMNDWCYMTDCVLRYDTATVSTHSEILHKRDVKEPDRYDSFNYSGFEKFQINENWKCSVDNADILDNVSLKRLYARAQALYGGNINLTAYLNKNLYGTNRIPTPESTETNQSGYQATYIMTHYDGGKDFNLNDHVEMRVHKVGKGDWFGKYDGPFQAFATNTDSNITETYYTKHDAAYGQFTSLINTSIDFDVPIARRAVFARDGFLWNRSEMAFMWDAIVDSKHVFSDSKYDETWIHQGKQYVDKTKSSSVYCSSTQSNYDPRYTDYYTEYSLFITDKLDISRKVGILRLDKNTKPTSTPSSNAATLNSAYSNVDNNNDLSLYDYRTNEYGQTILLASEEPLPKLFSELTIQNIAMKELDGRKINDTRFAEMIYSKYLEELYKDYSYDKELVYPPYFVMCSEDAYKETDISLEDAVKYLFEKDEGAALYDNLVKMSLDYNKITEDLKAISYKPINIGEKALRALIAKANEYNNNPENLVTAIFETIAQRDEETSKGIQEGVTCYVSSENKYYKYEDGKWSEMIAPIMNISKDAILEYETSCLIGFEISIDENGDIAYDAKPVYDINYHLKDVNGNICNINASLLQEVGVDKVKVQIPLFNVNDGDNRAVVEIYKDKNYFVEPDKTTGIINTDDNAKYVELSVDSMGYPLYVSNTYKYSNPQHYVAPKTGVQ